MDRQSMKLNFPEAASIEGNNLRNCFSSKSKRLLDDVFAGKIPKLRRMFPLACSEFYCSGRRSLDVVSSVALVAD
nr:hypothetical protein Iba_chr08fCG4130 [Ipomoea batatas]